MEPATETAASFELLAAGDYAAGWAKYEKRWDDEPATISKYPAAIRALFTRWPTAAQLRGKDVALFTEQGVGDTLMFASILPDLFRDAASVTMVGDARLQPLLQASFPALGFGSFGPDQVLLPLGSLGHAYRRGEGSFPGRPYLRPSPGATGRAAGLLGARGERRRIGLAWRGGVLATGSARRSVPLAQLRPLLERPDVEFVSLQYGDHAPEIAAVNASLPRPLRVLDANVSDDFDLAAALLLELDAVVSVQSALAHLAGAVGAPCLAMIPDPAEWRYGRTGDRMPWYDSVRLIRQPAPGDWDAVIAKVGEALDALPVRGG